MSGVSNTGTAASAVPDTVRYSFEVGALVLLGAMLWTIFTTREYPPAMLHGFADATPLAEGVEPGSAYRAGLRGLVWALVGGLGAVLVWRLELDRMLYVLALGVAAWGVLLLISAGIARRWRLDHADPATSTTCRGACAS